MAGGLTVSVRQIASYPAVSAGPGDSLLIQQGGLGGPYGAVNLQRLLVPLNEGAFALGVGVEPPSDSASEQIFTGHLNFPPGADFNFNAYVTAQGNYAYLGAGPAGRYAFAPPYGFAWQIASPGVGLGATIAGWSDLMLLSPAGGLSLPYGTLTVARDPGSALEVATAGWVGASTVASFNNRRGVVTLSAGDIYGALGICPPDTIATACSVDARICKAINDLLRTYPSVWSWMGRVGDVFLQVADMNFATLNQLPGLPPLMVPTPPATSADPAPDPLSVVNVQWVEAYVTALLAGPPAYATEDWVTQQIQSQISNAVVSFNGRTGAVTLNYLDVASLGFAPTNSPNFSGAPTAPTAAPGSSNSQLATTAFVMNTLTALTPGVVSFNGRGGTVTLEVTDIIDAGGAPVASPALSGVPTAPTAPVGNASTQIATTAFVAAAVAAATAGVASFNGRTGIVTLSLNDIEAAGGAPLTSPALVGVPTAPTAANGTNTTQLATTAFVQNELTAISAGVISWNGRSGAVTLNANDLSAVGGALLASPAFTNVPTAPTAAPGTSSTQLATTAFVQAALTSSAVQSFNGRSGVVTLAAADLTAAGGALLASPAFSGIPTAPTAIAGTATTQLATTAFVTAALAATSYVPTGGGTMTGTLNIAGAPNITSSTPAAVINSTALLLPLAQSATASMIGNVLWNAYLPSLASTNVLAVQTGIGAAISLVPGNSALNFTVWPSAAAGAAFAGGQTMAFTNGGLLTVPGIIQSTPGGRFYANGAGNSPAFIIGDSVATVIAGMWGGTQAQFLNFGLFNGALSPVTQWAYFASTGAFTLTQRLTAAVGISSNADVSASGTIQTSGMLVANASNAAEPGARIGGWGVLYPGVDATNAFSFWFNGTYVIARINGANDIALAPASDQRLKDNIQPSVFDGLAAVAATPLYQFTWKSNAKREPIGFVAQFTEPAFPSAVIGGAQDKSADGTDMTMNMNHNALLAAAYDAIKRLLARVEVLEAKAAA